MDILSDLISVPLWAFFTVFIIVAAGWIYTTIRLYHWKKEYHERGVKIQALTPTSSREVQVKADKSGGNRLHVLAPDGVKTDLISTATLSTEDGYKLARALKKSKFNIRLHGMLLTDANLPKGV